MVQIGPIHRIPAQIQQILWSSINKVQTRVSVWNFHPPRWTRINRVDEERQWSRHGRLLSASCRAVQACRQSSMEAQSYVTIKLHNAGGLCKQYCVVMPRHRQWTLHFVYWSVIKRRQHSWTLLPIPRWRPPNTSILTNIPSPSLSQFHYFIFHSFQP